MERLVLVEEIVTDLQRGGFELGNKFIGDDEVTFKLIRKTKDFLFEDLYITHEDNEIIKVKKDGIIYDNSYVDTGFIKYMLDQKYSLYNNEFYKLEFIEDLNDEDYDYDYDYNEIPLNRWEYA